VVVGKAPVTFKTVFGKYVISTGPELHTIASEIDGVWSYFAVTTVGIVLLLYLCTWLCLHQKEIHKAMDGIDDKDVDEDDPHVTAEEKHKEEEVLLQRMKIDSHDFIAPGNIYRLLAMLTPQSVGGWKNYLKYAANAFICSYMQLYLPWQLINGTLQHWRFLGIKSFFYFAGNVSDFMAAFVSLAALCTVVQGKCIQSVVEGAHANYYILTHHRPEYAEEGDGGFLHFFHTMENLVEGKGNLAPSYKYKVFWCTVSMAANIVMSLALQVGMYLTIATFKGSPDRAPLTAVALYFIFDLDNKIMDSHPKLKTLYRRHVLRCTVAGTDDPYFVKYMAGGMRIMAQMLGPMGLGAIVLFSWQERSTGFTIGGSPL